MMNSEIDQILETGVCEIHGLKKDYLFCLDSQCKDRLTCLRCYMRDQKHNGHNYVNIKQFMKKDKDQLQRIFNTTMFDILNQQKTVEWLLEMFDQKANQVLEDRYQRMQMILEQRMKDSKDSINRCKKQLENRLKFKEFWTLDQIYQNMKKLIDNDGDCWQQKEVKKQIDSCNNVCQIQKELELLIDEIRNNDQLELEKVEQIVGGKWGQKENAVLDRYFDNSVEVKEMEQYEKIISVSQSDKIDSYLHEIQQQSQQEYQIWIDFYTQNSSLESKQNVIEMIDDLNLNSKVGIIGVYLKTDNEIDGELMELMMKRFDNVHKIWIVDELDTVDEHFYGAIKQLIIKSVLIRFRLYFIGDLHDDQQGLEVIKECNKLIEDKQYLEHLDYRHKTISGQADSIEEVQEIIQQVKQIDN